MRLFTIFLLCLTGTVLAAPPYDVIPTFDPPITRIDGTALPSSEISRYLLYRNCDTTPVLIGPASVGSTLVATLPTDGAYSLCISAVDTDNQESARSAPFNFTVADIPEFPGAPSNLSVEVVCDGPCRVTVTSQ